MGTTADVVEVELKAKMRDYERDMARARTTFDGAMRDIDKATPVAARNLDRIERAGMKMGTGLRTGFTLAKGAAVGFVASLGVDAITGAIKSGLDYAAAIERQAKIANAGAQEFQKLAYAAKSVGIENDKLSDILKDVNDKAGEFIATGGGEMKDFFEKIAPKVGVTAEMFRKLSGPEALQLYVSSLEKAGLTQQQMTFYMEALADDATALIPILRSNGLEAKKLGDEAQRLGIIMDDAMISKSIEAQKQMGALNAVLQAKIATAVSENADSILGLADALVKLIDKAGQAADAWKRWRLEAGIRMQQNTIDGFLTSPGARTQARSNQRALQDELDRTNGKMVDPFRAGRNLREARSGGSVAGGADPGAMRVGGGGKGLGWMQALAYLPSPDVINSWLDKAKGASEGWTAELQSLAADLAVVNARITGDMEAMAAAEKQVVDARLRDELDRLKLEKDLKGIALQRRQDAARDKADADKRLIDQQLADEQAAKRARIERSRADLAVDALEAEARATASASERRDIERNILAARHEIEINAAEAAKLSAEEIDLIKRRHAAENRTLARDQQGPFADYRDRLNKSPADISRQVEGFVVNELDHVQDSISAAITKKLGTKDPLIGSLISLLIEQVVMKPIAEALANAQGGGGGFLGGLIGGVGKALGFGGFRANGGPVSAGRAYVVGEKGPEMIVPRSAGLVVPNHALSRRGGRTVVQQNINVDARGAVMNDKFASMILARANDYASRADAKVAQQVIKAVPFRMAQFDRDGL